MTSKAKTVKVRIKKKVKAATLGLLDAALAYAAKGYSVIPVTSGAKKPPYIKNWQSRATTDAQTIRAWWAEFPDANIGIATGTRSKLLVLDVDPRNGGFATMQALEEKHGELRNTLTADTPSGGRHYFFKTARAIRNSAGKLGPGVDVRCEGGYVVVAPSVVGEKAYAWST